MRRAGVGRAQSDAVSSYMPELRMAELHSAAMLALTFIRRARELGFTLDQVRTLLNLSANDGQGPASKYASLRHVTWARFGRKSPTCGLWSASWRMP